MKYYFVILNYNTASETISLISSIYEVKEINDLVKVIIVDNNSPDDSYDCLHKYYAHNRDVEIYRLPSNIGFSKANNFGYQRVLEHGDADFCIICNSDILIEQKSFFNKINNEYKLTNFGIMGPDVHGECETGRLPREHQSPIYPFEYSRFYLHYHYKKNLICLEKQLGLRNFMYYPKRIAFACVRAFYWKIVFRKYKCYYKTRHENIPIHGCFLVLSKNFMNHENKLFEPETLFYGEELLLYFKSIHNNIKIVYSPDLYVRHLQGMSAKTIKKDKDFFVLSNLIYSDLAILKEMNNL